MSRIHNGPELRVSDGVPDMFMNIREYGVCLMNPSGMIVNCSPGAEALYGYSKTEIITRNFSEFFSVEAEGVKPDDLLRQALDQGSYETECFQLRKDRQVFQAHIMVTALYNDGGSIRGFAAITRDITLPKKLENENKILNEGLEELVAQRTRELAIVNKELEAFSYSVSHDLRTPLRAINGYSEMLKEDYEHVLDAEGSRILNQITESAKMMGRLIDDLLSFSRMSRLEVMNDSVDMNKIVGAALGVIRHGTDMAHHAITVLSLPPCKGDPNMLKQVWINLIANALKYSSKNPDPKITVGGQEEKGSLIYYVKDNGAGFDMKYYNKLFGVFQRLHRQDEYEGTGLGLALSKRIISKHGGEIWAEASPNAGACFYFKLQTKR